MQFKGGELMPYIKEDTRDAMECCIDNLSFLVESKGDLNYAICHLVGKCILQNKIGYKEISEMIGAVHDAENELRRRLLVPYEVEKIVENGDVPSFKSIIEKIMR